MFYIPVLYIFEYIKVTSSATRELHRIEELNVRVNPKLNLEKRKICDHLV